LLTPLTWGRKDSATIATRTTPIVSAPAVDKVS
jgi:hypothetical protein